MWRLGPHQAGTLRAGSASKNTVASSMCMPRTTAPNIWMISVEAPHALSSRDGKGASGVCVVVCDTVFGFPVGTASRLHYYLHVMSACHVGTGAFGRAETPPDCYRTRPGSIEVGVHVRSVDVGQCAMHVYEYIPKHRYKNSSGRPKYRYRT